MFARHNRPEFADTCIAVHELTLAVPGLSQLESVDAQEQLEQAGAADAQLLRLVMCVSFATLTLALVSSLA